jgi:protein SCO1/2
VVGLLLLVSGCTAPVGDAGARVGPAGEGYRGGLVPPVPYVLPSVVLTDTSGGHYDLTTSPARPVTLLFFGYTSCRDVCPGVLGDLALALRRLSAADRERITAVFVTTDPARDNPERIRRYLDRFDPGYVGLTGSPAQVRAVAHAVGVEIEGRRERGAGDYALGHSAQVVGVDRSRHGVVLWEPGVPVADLSHDLALLVARAG